MTSALLRLPVERIYVSLAPSHVLVNLTAESANLGKPIANCAIKGGPLICNLVGRTIGRNIQRPLHHLEASQDFAQSPAQGFHHRSHVLDDASGLKDVIQVRDVVPLAGLSNSVKLREKSINEGQGVARPLQFVAGLQQLKPFLLLLILDTLTGVFLSGFASYLQILASSSVRNAGSKDGPCGGDQGAKKSRFKLFEQVGFANPSDTKNRGKQNYENQQQKQHAFPHARILPQHNQDVETLSELWLLDGSK
jgi:hypothetical protein